MYDYYNVTEREVIVGSTDGTGQGDGAAACSLQDFLKGELHDVLIDKHGIGTFWSVVKDVEQRLGVNSWTSYYESVMKKWNDIPVDPTLLSASPSPEEAATRHEGWQGTITISPDVQFKFNRGDAEIIRPNMPTLKFDTDVYPSLSILLDGKVFLAGGYFSVVDESGCIFKGSDGTSPWGLGRIFMSRKMFRRGRHIVLEVRTKYVESLCAMVEMDSSLNPVGKHLLSGF